MRKVYHKEKNVTAIAMAVFLGVGVTAVLFGILPFSHVIAKPRSLVQLRSVNAADLPPPVEAEAPPTVTEPEKKEEVPPELKLNEAPQQIALNADLEVAVGSGGALAGFGEVQKLAATEATQD